MAATSGPPPQTGQAQSVGGTGADELTTTDEVKEYCHEGEGEKTEHLNSMDLTDIKSELEKDAEEAEVSLLYSTVHQYCCSMCMHACCHAAPIYHITASSNHLIINNTTSL